MADNQGKPFIVLFIAVTILALISLIPLSEISGGTLKDYNLVGDLFPSDKTTNVAAETYIDPDLAVITEQESVASIEEPEQSGSITSDPVETEADYAYVMDDDFKSDGMIEDYTPDKNGLSRLRSAIASNRVARIAMLGDSYIEGDIFSQDIRNLLQQHYGGCGAGYVPVSSNLTGFRRSIRQTCSGWDEHDFRKDGKKHATLSGFYYTPNGNATTTVKGSKKIATAADWKRTTFLFIAPQALNIYIKLADNESREYNIEPSDKVQAIVIDGETDVVSLSASSPSLIALGLFIDGNNGIALDNMSIRGYAGIRHNILDLDLASQMREYIDYDLIILEYGINALSASQTDYTSYANVFEKSVKRIKECYPNADILLLGIGDRGVKNGTEVKSMHTVPAMISTQRKLARKLGIMFWDTREAMGGENSVVEWVNNRDINKDYIHLSFQGGERMGKLFVNALTSKLDD